MPARGEYCVYKHTTPTGKVYIGITSKPAEKRWLNGRGYARNEHFWNAIQKYGWGNIKHEILLSGLTETEACEKEQEFIATYGSHDPRKGYNLTTGGEAGTKHTEESRRKLSASKMGKRYNIGIPFTEERKQHLREHHADFRGEKNPRYGKKIPQEELARRLAHRDYKKGSENPSAKPILQLDMDGNIVKRWGSIVEASGEYCKTCIKDCLRGKYKQHKGYQWRYEDAGEK